MISTAFRFLKRNWKEVLIVACLLMVMGKMRADYNRLEEVHETMRTSLQDQITGLQEIHDEELRQRDAALRTYKEELEKLQRSYEVNLETIRSERDRKYQEYLHDFIKDPEQLAKDIEELFGFEYVE
jgi:hypothetical protein|tara:strand:- start:55 stop:435 length:381 start_codon:yes stop_codon:yes gene_type:complete